MAVVGVDAGADMAVLAASASEQKRAEALSRELALPLLPVECGPELLQRYPQILQISEKGLQLCQTGPKAPGPVWVDFLSGAADHRRRFGGGAGQQIAKAVGIKSGVRPSVVDATAGLGQDGFVLATLGCRVTLLERNPVVGLLLEDGLRRAAADPECGNICDRLRLYRQDAIDWLTQQCGQSPAQVIYLDPMFPHRDKSALVKKEMRVFREVVGADDDAEKLLAAALATDPYRVVVKRPRKAPPIAGPQPSYVLEGKSGRFDIYALKAIRNEAGS